MPSGERFAALNGSPMCESFIWRGYLAKHNESLRADEAKVSNLLASKSKRNSPVFEEDDVMLLLRVAVEREGGQTRFCETPRRRPQSRQQGAERERARDSLDREGSRASQGLRR